MAQETELRERAMLLPLLAGDREPMADPRSWPKPEPREASGRGLREKIKNSTSELMKTTISFSIQPLTRPTLAGSEKNSKIDEQTIGDDDFTFHSTTCRYSIGAEQALDLRVSLRLRRSMGGARS